jgi:copper transport protein
MRRVRLLAAAALVALAAACLAAPAAFASTTGLSSTTGLALPVHAALASTQPADGSVVSAAPQQVTASFDQTVGISASSLVVYSPSGQRVDDGQTTHVTAYEIAVGLLSGLGNGTYTAVWHVISADTHPVDGAFTFSVGAPSATHVGALLPPSDAMVSDLFAVVRWLEYLCYALLGGGVAFLIICWPEGGGRRGTGRLIAASGLGLLLSTLLGLLLQGPYGAGAGLSQVFSASLVRATLRGSLGPASEARELMSLLAVGAAAFMFPRLPAASARARRAYGALWAVLITAIAASWAVYDHASTGVQAPWGIPADVIHLDAVALWVGGLAMLARFTLRLPAVHGRPDADLVTGAAVTRAVITPEAARAASRFSPIALGCVAAIVASGVYQTWREVGAWGALLDTAYGRLILAKIAGLLVLITLGYVARRFIQRGSAGAELVPTLRRLRRSVAAELTVAVVILVLTALLVNTATGRESYAPTFSASQPFNTGGPNGAGTVHVFASPARLGPNTVQLYFTAPGGKSLVPAQVTAALYFPAKGLGPLPVTLAETAPGQYRAQDATVTFTGQWTLQVIVRSDAFDETSVTFPLAVH